MRAAIVPADYLRYGAPGSRIPGSRFYRGYCRCCALADISWSAIPKA